MGERAADDAERVREGHRVGIACLGEGAEGCLVHQRTQGKVGEQKAPGFLEDQVGRLAAQDPLRPAPMGFEFVERGLDLPALVIERGEFGSGRARRLAD